MSLYHLQVIWGPLLHKRRHERTSQTQARAREECVDTKASRGGTKLWGRRRTGEDGVGYDLDRGIARVTLKVLVAFCDRANYRALSAQEAIGLGKMGVTEWVRVGDTYEFVSRYRLDHLSRSIC